MNLYIIGIYLLIISIFAWFIEFVYFIPLCILGLMILLFRKNLDLREKILYLIIGCVFLVRGITGVEFGVPNIGDRVEMIVQSKSSSSSIEKIDGKLLRKRIYLEENIGGNGRYRISGDIIEKNIDRGQISYKLNIYEKEKIDTSIVRKYLDKRIDLLMRGYSKGLENFYKGIIVGEKDGLDRDLKDKFAYTGTSHLIVISGLHIGVIIALMMWIAGRLPISHDVRYIGVIIALSLYVLAVGGTPSVVRAYIMGMCYLCGGLFYEESEGKRSLLVAMIINLIIDPLGAGRISFQLSYIAVFTILFIFPYYEKRIKNIENTFLKWVLTMGGLSLAIQLALTPIFMMNFRSVPFLSFLVNIVAIPIGVLFVQGAFLALLFSVVGIGSILMPTVNLLYHILVGFIGWASRLPLLSIEYRGVTKVWYPLIIYLGIYLLLSKKRRSLSPIILGIFMLLNRERTSDYNGDGYSYYYPKIMVAQRKLSFGDMDKIWDNRIKRQEIMISSEKQDEELMEKLRIERIVVLKEREEITVGELTFKNIKGNIKVEKISE